MCEGKRAELEMKKTILAGEVLEQKVFECSILRYNAEQERVYLILENDELTSVSLDGIYECRIEAGKIWLVGEGRIVERYYNEAGKILELQIENGFYKNNIKSVDKQEVE